MKRATAGDRRSPPPSCIAVTALLHFREQLTSPPGGHPPPELCASLARLQPGAVAMRVLDEDWREVSFRKREERKRIALNIKWDIAITACLRF